MPNFPGLIVQCCVCHRVRGPGGRFRDFAVPRGAEVSHTYCPACAREALGSIRRDRRQAESRRLLGG